MDTIDLIGHSRGSWVITDVGDKLKQNYKVNAISLDNSINYQSWDSPHEHLHLRSRDYKTSHSGMIFNKDVLQACYQFIQMSAKEKLAAAEVKTCSESGINSNNEAPFHLSALFSPEEPASSRRSGQDPTSKCCFNSI
jgi:hypothetical protein